jgi:predicted nucleotidyltransferase
MEGMDDGRRTSRAEIRSEVTLTLTAEQLAVYRRTAQERQQAEEQAVSRRRQRAWRLARRVAALLKKEYQATRVVVFGSLIHKDCFTLWSDVDIAAWGIRPQDTFRAIGAMIGLDPEIQVNLVDVGACRPALLAVIDREGVNL